MKEKGYKLQYYDMMDELLIHHTHVARFFGCQVAQAFKGLSSIDDTWSTHKSLDAIGTC